MIAAFLHQGHRIDPIKNNSVLGKFRTMSDEDCPGLTIFGDACQGEPSVSQRRAAVEGLCSRVFEDLLALPSGLSDIEREALSLAMASGLGAALQASRGQGCEVAAASGQGGESERNGQGCKVAAERLLREADQQQRWDAVGRQWQAEAREQLAVDEAKVEEVVKERACREAAEPEMSLEEAVRRRVAAEKRQEAAEARATAAEERAQEAEWRAAALEADMAKFRVRAAKSGRRFRGVPPLAAMTGAALVAEETGGGDSGCWRCCSIDTDKISLWKYVPVNGYHMNARVTPDIKGPKSGFYVEPGDVLQIVEERKSPSGLLYLKLKHDKGWVCDRKPGVGTMCERIEALASAASGQGQELDVDVGQVLALALPSAASGQGQEVDVAEAQVRGQHHLKEAAAAAADEVLCTDRHDFFVPVHRRTLVFPLVLQNRYMPCVVCTVSASDCDDPHQLYAHARDLLTSALGKISSAMRSLSTMAMLSARSWPMSMVPSLQC